MANLGNVADGRPFRQDDNAGFQSLNNLNGNDQEIANVIRRLMNDDGSPNDRSFTRCTGNYVFSAGSYVLQKQSTYIPILPASIAPAAHIITITFTASIPESTYDVQLTPSNTGPSTYATMQYDPGTKSVTQLVIYPFVNGSSADIGGFSIALNWG